MRECLKCGFMVPRFTPVCAKCGSELGSQTDGSWARVDIGHRGETVAEAIEKFNAALAGALSGPVKYLRVVTGMGKISHELRGRLGHLKRSGQIVGFSEEGRNRGAIVIQLRR